MKQTLPFDKKIDVAQQDKNLQHYVQQLETMIDQRTTELQSERDRTKAILDAVGEAIVVTNVEGVIQYMNVAATTLTGYSLDEAIGQKCLIFHRVQQPKEWYNTILERIRQGQFWQGEVINKRKDGTLYDAIETIAPLFDLHQPDCLIGLVSVQRDITPLKESERLKDRFIANVSHELRTPLSVITLLSGSLESMYTRLDDEKRQEMIRDIRKHTKVLNELITDILEISRIDSKNVSLERERLNFAQLIREEVEKQFVLAQKKHQTIQVEGGEELPVRGNEGQLRQVIRNVINNAIKYTPNNGVVICDFSVYHTFSQENIRDTPIGKQLNPFPGSDTLSDGPWATFRVIDNGIGMEKEDMLRVFERFYRIANQGDIPGTGLGLAIAKELVTLHAGHIAIDSLPNYGTIIAMYLPYDDE